MENTEPRPKRLLGNRPELFLAALGLYAILSGYLHWPYFSDIGIRQSLFIVNPVIAAWGAYFLSKRWVNSWTPSLLAGAAYGFSPFALSFAAFQQPVAGLSYVLIPWLFLPSVYWHKNRPANSFRFLVRMLFCLLPFAAIAGLFWCAAQKWAGPHFLMPVSATLTDKHLLDLIFPLFQKGECLTFGVYHTAIILAILGLCVVIKIQRVTVFIPVAAALILCFIKPVLGVSPIAWAAIPVLFLAILSGLGFQSALWAGKADWKWLLSCAVIASILAAFFGGLAYKRFIGGVVLQWTAMMYALTAICLWLILFLTCTGLRWKPIKWLLLTAAAGIDLVYSARYLVDKLF